MDAKTKNNPTSMNIWGASSGWGLSFGPEASGLGQDSIFPLCRSVLQPAELCLRSVVETGRCPINSLFQGDVVGGLSFEPFVVWLRPAFNIWDLNRRTSNSVGESSGQLGTIWRYTKEFATSASTFGKQCELSGLASLGIKSGTCCQGWP